MIDEDIAYHIIKDVTQNMREWKGVARDSGLSDKEMETFTERFEEGISWNH